MIARENKVRLGWIAIGIAALTIAAYVLFQYPQPGVADQGDFDRVSYVSGLKIPEQNFNDPAFVRFYDYIVTDYEITDFSTVKLLGRLITTSIAFPITVVSLICKLFGQDTFKTGYLAVAYLFMYFSAGYVILRYLTANNWVKLLILAAAALFVFPDGNYLVWFNSLYGEPMMIITLTMFIAAWLYYIYKRYELGSEQVFPEILIIYLTAYLFLGSKMQVIVTLPIILAMIAKLIWDNRRWLKRAQLWLLLLLSCVLIIYPCRVNLLFKSLNEDTRYNSVFYGILKDSPNPAQDLSDLGLDSDLIVEAGKHAYMKQEEYVRYSPASQLTKQVFFNNLSNIDLINFYITHPARLKQAMEFTASQAFKTSTNLGKYSQSYSAIPIAEFDRFTLWSSIREHELPRNLGFILAVYIAVLAISTKKYRASNGAEANRARITLLWGIMLIGLIQFPMPYIGNGQHDVAKQLFLFNFVFDIMLVVSACWCADRLSAWTHCQTARSN